MPSTMLLRRSAFAISRRAVPKPIVPLASRPFTTSIARRKSDNHLGYRTGWVIEWKGMDANDGIDCER